MAAQLKRLKLFAEGKGDVAGTWALVKRLLAERDDRPFEHLILDDQPFRIGGIHDLTGRVADNWTNRLVRASRQQGVAGILAILDGDADAIQMKNEQTGKLERTAFCASSLAIHLAKEARTTGAGVHFSVALVFAMKEYESWLIGGIESLSKTRIAGLKQGVLPPPNIEQRSGAKEWISKHMDRPYKPTIHQLPMTEAVAFTEIRQKNLRSFRRLEHAIDELVCAFRDERHVVTPAVSSLNISGP